MKMKDIGALVILAIVLIILGSFLLQRVGKTNQRSAEVEVVFPISPEFNNTAKEILTGKDPNAGVNTTITPIDIQQGFGNSDSFNAGQ